MTNNRIMSDPIIIESQFEADRDVIWKAISDHGEMVQWFFEDIPDFRAEAGFETSFNVSAEQRDYFHLWKITEAVPGKKIVFDWRYKDVPGEGVVTFQLIDVPNSDRVKLHVINEGLETFPNDVPEFTEESCVGGWNYFINEELKLFLDSR